MFRRTLPAILLFILQILMQAGSLSALLAYRSNVEFIATELCINRDKPELQCNGKCQLLKEVEKSQHKAADQKSVPNSVSSLPYIGADTFKLGILEERCLPYNSHIVGHELTRLAKPIVPPPVLV
jgi:hypothetical protein